MSWEELFFRRPIPPDPPPLNCGSTPPVIIEKKMDALSDSAMTTTREERVWASEKGASRRDPTSEARTFLRFESHLQARQQRELLSFPIARKTGRSIPSRCPVTVSIVPVSMSLSVVPVPVSVSVFVSKPTLSRRCPIPASVTRATIHGDGQSRALRYVASGG